MSLIADIRYALKRARAERYIDEGLERYESQLIRCVKSGVARPLSVPARMGRYASGEAADPLTDAEWERYHAALQALHDKYF